MIYKVKYHNVLAYCLFFALIKPYFIPEPMRQITKIMALILILVFLCSKMEKRKLVNISLLFCFFIILSAIVNIVGGDYTIKAFFDSILFAFTFYNIYTFSEYCCYNNYMKDYIKCLYRMNVLYCLITIFSVLLNGTMNNSNEIAYAFGNKFTCSYLFVLLLSLFGASHDMSNKKNRFKFIILSILSIVFSLYIGCATTVIALVLVVGICFLPKSIKDILANGKIVILLLIVTALLVFFFESILQIDFVNNIVVGFFDKTYTIYGRIEIYSVYLTDVILDKLWFGYGYNNGLMMKLTGVYANAQNGLLEQVVNFGILGTLSLLFTIYYCYKNKSKNNTIFYLNLVVYGMIFAAVVEVSINWFFLLGICLIRWNKLIDE